MPTIAILGANGVYARHLLPRLAGRDVRAIVRRPEAANVARACGANVRTADILDESALVAALDGCDIAINLATTLPGPSGRGDYAANDRLRTDGVPIFLAACQRAGVSRVLQQSIAWMNPAGGDSWSDEETPYAPPQPDTVAARATLACMAMEESVRASDLDWLILRGALFYGPGTGFDETWFALAREGKLRLPADGADFVSLVHIADMAAATIAALDGWPSKQTLIVSDNEPVRWRELFGHIAEICGAAPPQPGGRAGFPSFRVSNGRARALLDWSPFYSSYRAGLAR